MKTVSFLLLIVTLSCQNNRPETTSKSQNFDWLIGAWQRTNDEQGRQTYEYWNKSHDSLYIGFSYTLQGSDTVFSEKVLLNRKKTQWSYDVVLANDSTKIPFLFTDFTDISFVCENPANDFPKKIMYQMRGDSIYATISGGGAPVDYWFGKISSPR